VVCALCGLAAGCVSLSESGPTELTFQSLNAIDYAQTINIARQPDCYREADPVTSGLIGQHPSTGAVVAMWAVQAGAHYYVTRWLDREVDATDAEGWRVVRLPGVECRDDRQCDVQRHPQSRYGLAPVRSVRYLRSRAAGATMVISLTRLYRAVVEPTDSRGVSRHAFIEAPTHNAAMSKIAAVISALEHRIPDDVRDRIYNCHSAQELVADGVSEDLGLRLFESGWSCGRPTYVRQPLILLDAPAADPNLDPLPGRFARSLVTANHRRRRTMSPGNPARLLKLADREFRQLTGKPVTPEPSRKFKPICINLARLDSGWEKKRGAAMRLTAVLLREDDTALQQRVCENERTAKTYSDAADWLQRESAYLRKMARLLETAGGRVSVVLGRCGTSSAAPTEHETSG
jgi:hypothetical protein